MTTTRPLTTQLPALELLTVEEGAPICTGAMHSSGDGFTQTLHCSACNYETIVTTAHLQVGLTNPITPWPAIPDVATQLADYIEIIHDAILQSMGSIRVLSMLQCLPSQFDSELSNRAAMLNTALGSLVDLRTLLGLTLPAEPGIESHETLVLRAVPREVGVR